MKKLLILLSAAAAVTFFAPMPSIAQGIGIQVPGVGVQIGEPDRPRYREHNRGYREDYRERRGFREREVRGGCRTVTIERDDGSVKRIRKCD
jgi:hypothetical protein